MDNNPKLSSGSSHKELQDNLDLAGAQFSHIAMTPVNRVLTVSNKPDIIIIRHPGRLHDEFDTVVQRINPWIQYAAIHSITTLLSFFDWHGEEKDKLVEDVIQPHINPLHIQLVSKTMETARGYHNVSSSSTMFPDFFGIRVF